VEDVEITIVDQILLGCKGVSNDQQIKYSGAAFYFYATLRLGGISDPIAIIPGDPEGCHLPWRVNFELEMWCAKRMNETTSVCVATGSRVFLCPLFYRDPVQKLQAFPFCPYSRSKQDQKMMCGFSSCSKKCLII
jgi:hypothetical protein